MSWTYTNVPDTGTALSIGSVATNYGKFQIANGTNGRTLILKLAGTNLTDSDLKQVENYITTSHGSAGSGDSAFTIAGFGTADGSAFVSGTTELVYLALQGTGTLTDADADCGISGYTVSTVAVLVAAK